MILQDLGLPPELALKSGPNATVLARENRTTCETIDSPEVVEAQTKSPARSRPFSDAFSIK